MLILEICVVLLSVVCFATLEWYTIGLEKL